jgi:hypothetical protein
MSDLLVTIGICCGLALLGAAVKEGKRWIEEAPQRKEAARPKRKGGPILPNAKRE